MDIYNDAATKALHGLKCQYIYDEIEAEVNLVVDQLVFKISNAIYRQYKCLVAGMVLETDLKGQVETNSSEEMVSSFNWIHNIMKQRSVQVGFWYSRSKLVY